MSLASGCYYLSGHYFFFSLSFSLFPYRIKSKEIYGFYLYTVQKNYMTHLIKRIYLPNFKQVSLESTSESLHRLTLSVGPTKFEYYYKSKSSLNILTFTWNFTLIIR